MAVFSRPSSRFTTPAITTTTKTLLLLRHFQPQRSYHATVSTLVEERRRHKSTTAAAYHDDDYDNVDEAVRRQVQRLRHYRNVGVFAHVDAGKTTVTERMLALAGTVARAGCVDDGNTVTDYLPAERERGITIQSAAIRFPWAWHNNPYGDDYAANDSVTIALIDTPGHVDFSVEVNRSVAVLDGAVLVVDAVAGVQAQTETVWRAMTQHTSMSNYHALNHTNSSILEEDEEWTAGLNFKDGQSTPFDGAGSSHEPLPCVAVINKMDKVGHNFGLAVKSLRNKLPGANPIPIQIPLFRTRDNFADEKNPLPDLVALNPWTTTSADGGAATTGEFMGVVDLIHMRAIVWPDVAAHVVSNVEACAPLVFALRDKQHQPRHSDCAVTQVATQARQEMMAALAEVDEAIEEYFLMEEEPSNAELRQAFRRATLDHKALPVLAAAALRGKGIEPCLDAIADLLPSPLDRQPPSLTYWDNSNNKGGPSASDFELVEGDKEQVRFGHSLHPSALAFAFKVLHMKGRGGSGDGRVVFARVYSGTLKDRDTIHVVSPPALGEAPEKPRVERIGGMLEMAGGSFGKRQNGECQSGEVCALIGLKSVVTGDTIVLAPEKGSSKKKNKENVFLAGVSAPRPVLKVRLETETMSDQKRLSEALRLLSIEDPSIVVEETEAATLLSGLGELHVEIVLDRLHREFCIPVIVGAPSVAYRESLEKSVDTNGLVKYDQTIGDTRLEASVHLSIEPLHSFLGDSMAMVLQEPKVTIEPAAREYLQLNEDKAEDDLVVKSPLAKALVQGCIGALKRGPLGPYPMSNVICRVVNVDCEDGLSSLEALPGALRAAAANAILTLLKSNQNQCTVLEPTMSIEVTLPNDMVGAVLSDLTSRRGNVGDVYVGDTEGVVQAKALVRGEVPLIEILGYANSLRSLTAGEASFTAEYKGHAPCKS